MSKIFWWLEKNLGQHPFSIITTNFFTLLLSIVIIWLCWNVSAEQTQRVFNVLIALSGAITGWALGMFFAPFNNDEAAKFSSIGQAVSAFVSGYLFSKLDRFLEAVMFHETTPVASTWVRFGLFFCSLLVVMLAVFSNRSYFRAGSTIHTPSLNEAPQQSITQKK